MFTKRSKTNSLRTEVLQPEIVNLFTTIKLIFSANIKIEVSIYVISLFLNSIITCHQPITEMYR